MRQKQCLLGFLFVALVASYANASSDQFTPVVVAAFTANAHPFEGTDGRMHIVYELIVMNTNSTPATLKKVEVLDAADPAKVLASYNGSELLLHLRSTGGGGVKDATLELNSTRFLLVDLSLPSTATIPSQFVHHLEVLGASGPSRTATTPVLLDYTVAPIDVSRNLRVIGPPLAGKGWVATNGCCAPGSAHRASSLAVNGQIFFAQRFAIDWMQMNPDGRFVTGTLLTCTTTSAMALMYWQSPTGRSWRR